MSAMYRLKAYFGMVPVEEMGRTTRRERSRTGTGGARGGPPGSSRRTVGANASPTTRTTRERADDWDRTPARSARPAAVERTRSRPGCPPGRCVGLRPDRHPRVAGHRPRPGAGSAGSRAQPAARAARVTPGRGPGPVPDHHAAPAQLQRGAHHRRALPRRHAGDHEPDRAWTTRTPSASSTSRPGWRSRCAGRSTRSPAGCSFSHRPNVDVSAEDAAEAGRGGAVRATRPLELATRVEERGIFRQD